MLSGNPGNKGGTGRPPLAFKNFIAQLRENPSVQKELEDTLLDKDSKHYAAALRVIVDYDEELPANLTAEQRKARVIELLREADRRRKRA